MVRKISNFLLERFDSIEILNSHWYAQLKNFGVIKFGRDPKIIFQNKTTKSMKKLEELNYLMVNYIDSGSRECIGFFKVYYSKEFKEKLMFSIPLDPTAVTRMSKVLSNKHYVDYQIYQIRYLIVIQIKGNQFLTNQSSDSRLKVFKINYTKCSSDLIQTIDIKSFSCELPSITICPNVKKIFIFNKNSMAKSQILSIGKNKEITFDKVELLNNSIQRMMGVNYQGKFGNKLLFLVYNKDPLKSSTFSHFSYDLETGKYTQEHIREIGQGLQHPDLIQSMVESEGKYYAISINYELFSFYYKFQNCLI